MAADDVPVLRSDPLADDIFPLATEGRKLQIVYQCLKLGIFDEIESLGKSETAENIASNLGSTSTSKIAECATLNNGYIIECGVYCLTESSKKYMVSTKPTSMVPRLTAEFEFMFPLFNSLPSVLKRGSDGERYQQFIENETEDGESFTSGTSGAGNNPRGDITTRKPSPADFLAMMNAKLVPIAPAVTQSYDFSGYRTLVDLGGGSGYMAYEFIKVYEKLKAIVFDLPDSIELAVQQQPQNTKSRVEFMSGDFFQDEKLPVCDLMILSHILHNWCDDKIDIILKKVFASINPGGCILLLEKCLNEDKTGPYDAILLDTMMMVICEGRERTFLEYQMLLQQYGFTNVIWREMHGRNCQDVILALKPEENI
ncbi:hypothetical protein LOTGIDRAFT_164936 [Lottia gigantea]|uniref:Acetylserotonin O-methyltransferase n=1 Tax=Lottia gigantea TaxID=225164 RepID=V4A8K8_LOTGI|nr:hypothetical protein LOTGIDRAFT_164936 [Lottia gigantea]ESO89631.1 hypothetical protein LOTGIDRAFT_164936 [Lottia gigantea]